MEWSDYALYALKGRIFHRIADFSKTGGSSIRGDLPIIINASAFAFSQQTEAVKVRENRERGENR